MPNILPHSSDQSIVKKHVTIFWYVFRLLCFGPFSTEISTRSTFLTLLRALTNSHLASNMWWLQTIRVAIKGASWDTFNAVFSSSKTRDIILFYSILSLVCFTYTVCFIAYRRHDIQVIIAASASLLHNSHVGRQFFYFSKLEPTLSPSLAIPPILPSLSLSFSPIPWIFYYSDIYFSCHSSYMPIFSRLSWSFPAFSLLILFLLPFSLCPLYLPFFIVFVQDFMVRFLLSVKSWDLWVPSLANLPYSVLDS